ncbi:hypothetical protein MTR_4g066320 [Medicago truncatula]|uniref:Uncharacterized protein n=2 Tax=Medicago truncatula TaxID=3880 RepID=A0A072ULM5_MEDTR|nr:hypothetical protein MTR_4g066320 [Medicago truncatula]
MVVERELMRKAFLEKLKTMGFSKTLQTNEEIEHSSSEKVVVHGSTKELLRFINKLGAIPRKQPNGNDFGYYVMKNIVDIISANITKSWMEVFNDPTAILTEDELYDLRNQWATWFLDLFKV